jgi:hypothetical protein
LLTYFPLLSFERPSQLLPLMPTEEDSVPKELTWNQAIKKVLAEADAPMHSADITDRIVAEGLRTSIGATPAETVVSQITVSMKHQGDESPYVRVAKGVYALKSGVDITPPPDTPVEKRNEAVAEEQEEQYAIVTSFGMFWRRESVEWARTPKLLGKQQSGATGVDFCGQRGVYLLYDGREVIYVGRATGSGAWHAAVRAHDRPTVGPLGPVLVVRTLAGVWGRRAGRTTGCVRRGQARPGPRGHLGRGARAAAEPQARR